MSKIILGGVLQTFPKYIGDKIYSEEMFAKVLDEYKHKMIMEVRIKKINKICQSIK